MDGRNLTMGVVALGCFSGAAMGQVPELVDSPGRTIYLRHCASCHGRNLTGGNAQSMADGVWQFGASRNLMFRNIKFGISSVGMPDYQDALSNREINQVIDYILDEGKQAGATRPPIPESLQTRDYDVIVETWIDGDLSIPWALTFVDDDSALLTERPGRLRLITDGRLHPEPIRDTPEVLHAGQGGLMDVAVDPNYEENGWVYLSYSHALGEHDGEGRDNRPAMTRIVRGRIKDHRWVDHEVLYEAPHNTYRSSRHHYGSRIAFDHDGYLYFTIGDRGARPDAQQLDRPNGKVHRITSDGSIPTDNPFRSDPRVLPSIWSYGHRNPQGLATHPSTGEIWSTEHGPMGGDELNLLPPGANYGWPTISYGINYNGREITDKQVQEGMLQPVLYWTPSIAVCGMDFMRGDEFPRWRDHLFVTGLGYEEVRRLNIMDGRVIYQEVILKGAGRVRDIACGPDGRIYVVLNSPDVVLVLRNGGRVLRQ